MALQTLVDDEIEREIYELNSMTPGTDEYKTTVNGIVALLEKSIDADRLSFEIDEKQRQFEEDKKDRMIRNVLTALGIIIPSGITVWGTIKSIQFEKEGTISTLIGRGFINKLLPRK